jgi:hypothetical protein
MLMTDRRGEKDAQAAEAKEGADGTLSPWRELREDEVGGEVDAMQPRQPAGTLEEGDDLGVFLEPGATSQPVAQCGPGHPSVAGELALTDVGAALGVLGDKRSALASLPARTFGARNLRRGVGLGRNVEHGEVSGWGGLGTSQVSDLAVLYKLRSRSVLLPSMDQTMSEANFS